MSRRGCAHASRARLARPEARHRMRRRQRASSRASDSSSAFTCAASSRVGTSTSAEGRLPFAAVRSTIGSPNASVLPDPVGDFASTSRPASASGRTSSWMRKGFRMERAASSSTTAAETPSSRNDFWDMCCSTPLWVRDLPTSKHPEEEREAHLTGGMIANPYSHSSNRRRQLVS